MSSESQGPRIPSSAGSRSDPIDDATALALEDLLRLAAAALGVERCVAGLASPRDGWIRTVVGAAPNEAQSYAGFCSFAMMQAGPTVVCDMRKIGALAHLPLVHSERGYRLLAGGPIVDASDVKRGGLAALGTTPRELSREEREMLSVLERQIAAHLDNRRRVEELWTRGLHQAGALSMLRGVLKASTTVAVIGTDPSGSIKLFSEGAERLLGVPAREAAGRTPGFLLAGRATQGLEDIVPESSGRSIPFAALIEGVSHDIPVERTWFLRRANGSLFPASVVTAVVTNENGEASGYAIIARDITEQRAVERMKDDFVSMVSHELRTPLTSIRGALGLLIGEVAGPMTPSVHELVSIAHANTDRLLHVVGDILDIQRLASGAVELAMEHVSVHSAAEKAIQLVGPLAAGREVTLAIRRTTALDVVEADFERIVQVLVNLLSNAVKHSPAGGVVHADIELDEHGVRVSVEDAGPGVPEELRGRLFQKFARASSESGGTGLGLSIVKAIVSLHGGTVSFRPASPHGSIFFFDLPRARVTLPAGLPPPVAAPVSSDPIPLKAEHGSRR